MEDKKYPLLRARAVKEGLGNRNPDIEEEGVKRLNLVCQWGSSQNQQYCNDRAASMLESLGDIYGKINDHWRGRGFTKAAAVLRGLKMEITQVQRLKNLKKEDPGRVKGIGDSVMSLLEEFYREGEAQRLARLSSDPLVSPEQGAAATLRTPPATTASKSTSRPFFRVH
ncbi:unnamed protein product [Ascophyllum nodosum]